MQLHAHFSTHNSFSPYEEYIMGNMNYPRENVYYLKHWDTNASFFVTYSFLCSLVSMPY